MKINKSKIENYIYGNARGLDIALYDFYFNNGDKAVVIKELSKYQNHDGGFGNALEPDVQTPDSSPYVTTIALQYLVNINVDKDEEIVKSTIKYLNNTYNKEIKGWLSVSKSVEDYPHAPWWRYEEGLKEEWGNPSAEILAYLLFYDEENNLIPELKQKALNRLQKIVKPEFHELKNYCRLYELANENDFKEKIYFKLSKLILEVAEIDSTKWGGYVSTPLTFIENPKSKLASIFNLEILEKNIEFLISTIKMDNHWEPNWSWGELYPEVWDQAKGEWSGFITVNTLKILNNFDKF